MGAAGAAAWLQWLALGLSAYGVVWLTACCGTAPSSRCASRWTTSPRAPERLVLGGPGGATNLDVELGTPVTWCSLTGRRSRQVTAVSVEVADAALASREIAAAVGR